MGRKLIPLGNGECEYVEKRSSFLGHLRHVESEEEARAFIAEMKKKYHDARHNCWCYICGGAERYSDDGEPQGTAGLPMLEVFRKEGVTDFVCVVTRYFGGILLGAGGLLRAYTKTAKDALDSAGITEVKPFVKAHLSCPYRFADEIKNDVSLAGGSFEAVYGGNVEFEISLPEEQIEKFSEKIKNKKMNLEF